MKSKLLLLGLFPLLGIGLVGQEASDVVLPKKGRLDKFIAEIQYNDSSNYNKIAMDLNKTIADEGFVLLKNLDGFLPMTSGDEKISMVGKSSTSLVRGGAGSGSGSVSGGIQEIKMADSLTSAEVGFNLNQQLVSFYNGSSSGSGRTNGNTNWTGISQVTIGETPLSKYSQALLDSMDEYNDAIIMVISREGSEGCDVKTGDARDSNSDPFTTKHALELSDNEQALFDEIKTHSDNIIIIVNSGNIFECDKFENDDQVKAIIWMGTPGANGANAIGRILRGIVNPSGRTVSTWTRDFTKDPTWQNFSDSSQTNLIGNKFVPQDTMLHEDGSAVRSDGTYVGDPVWDDEANKVPKFGLNGVRPASYVSYEEGVYLDYRYYETRYQDKEAEKAGSGEEWYASDEGVIYPFGYGLSYTSFSQEIVSCNLEGKTLTNGLEKANVKVKVKNTGSVAGKDVVQLYWKAPYTNGGIEKPYEVLAAFDKTHMLNPGESQELSLSFYIQDVANYDYTDANNNGFKGYELDGGKYEISVNKNAHEAYDKVSFKIANSGFQYAQDRYTGNKVENRFSDENFYKSTPIEGGVEFTNFSRADWDNTFPKSPSIEDRTITDDCRAEEFYNHKFTIADVELNDDGEYIPLAAKKTKEDIEALGWSQVASNGTSQYPVQFKDMLGADMDDPRWDEMLNDLKYSDLLNYVCGGNDHNPAISKIGKETTRDSDGPGKFQTMWWCGGPIVAATYNVELARKIGDCVGIEAHASGSTYGWAGPGVNIHRSPFGGRNFEYYSADPLLTGRIAGRVVAGASDRGVYCFFKHFAVNDQEKGREGISAFVNEQALREIYLRPFQLVIQEGKSMGIMSSYNRLGMMETAASYPLLTEVLRNEWGFKGSIISDMTHQSNSAFDHGMYENINNRVLAGCNNQLDGSSYKSAVDCTWSNEKGCPVFKDANGDEHESYSWWYALRQGVKECFWMQAHCGVYDRTFALEADGMEIEGLTYGCLNLSAGEKVNVKITLDDSYDVGQDYNGKVIASSELMIDPVTPLPDGLTFEDGVISGVAEKAVNQFVRVLVKVEFEGASEPTYFGKSFELYVAAPMDAVTASGGESSGAGLPMGAIIGIIVGAVVVIAAGVTAGILVSKKKKKTA